MKLSLLILGVHSKHQKLKEKKERDLRGFFDLSLSLRSSEVQDRDGFPVSFSVLQTYKLESLLQG